MFEENFYKLGDDKRLHDNGIRVTVLGQRELLPERVQKAIAYAEERTASYPITFTTSPLAYGSRQEIVQAIKRDRPEGQGRRDEGRGHR